MSDREASATPRWRKVAGIASTVAVVVAVFGFVLPSVADYGDVLDAVSAMTWLEVATLVLAGLWNLATYQPALMAALPGLRFGQAFQVSQASTAVSNTVPAGAAFGVGLSAAMYRSWGFKRRPVALSLLVGGIWNIFLKLALPIVAVAILVVSGNSGGGLVAAAVAGLVALGVALALGTAILRSEHAASAIGDWGSARVSGVRRWFGKPPIGGFGHTLVKFRRETIDLLRTRWIALTIATVTSHLSLVLVLLVALRHVGVADDEVAWQEVLATFAFVRLLSALPVTPGGLGVIELGLTGGLVAAGGDHAGVVAAVLVYRALTYLPPIPLGALCYVFWRRSNAETRTDEPELEPLP